MNEYKYVKEAITRAHFNDEVNLPGASDLCSGYFSLKDAGALEPVGDEYKAILPNGETIETPNRNRQKSVFLQFESESGDVLVVLYLFHKGCTYRTKTYFVDRAKKAALAATEAKAKLGPSMFGFDI